MKVVQLGHSKAERRVERLVAKRAAWTVLKKADQLAAKRAENSVASTVVRLAETRVGSSVVRKAA